MPSYVKCIYKEVLDDSKSNYYKKFVYSVLITIGIVLFDKLLISILPLYSDFNYLNWFVSSIILGIVDAGIVFLILFFTMKSFKALMLRFKRMVIKKWKLV